MSLPVVASASAEQRPLRNKRSVLAIPFRIARSPSHAAAEARRRLESVPSLDVVVSERTGILELFAGENDTQ
jgi:hypothetical protein